MAYRLSTVVERTGDVGHDTLDRAIEASLERGGIPLAAQPVVSATGNEPKGSWVELLIRPVHEGRALAPDTVIDRAAESGLARPLDLLVITQGLEWLARTPRVDLCSINVSGHSVSHPGFLGEVLGLIEGAGVDPARLCLEVTETVPIRNFASARNFAAGMRAAGCRMALDDFGTGASNMLMLVPMEMDYLKIDGRFVRHVPGREDYTKLVRGIVAFAQTVGLRTVAECVETREQYDCALEMGIDFIQGYYREGEPRLVDPAGSLPGWERRDSGGRGRSHGTGTTGAETR